MGGPGPRAARPRLHALLLLAAAWAVAADPPPLQEGEQVPEASVIYRPVPGNGQQVLAPGIRFTGGRSLSNSSLPSAQACFTACDESKQPCVWYAYSACELVRPGRLPGRAAAARRRPSRLPHAAGCSERCAAAPCAHKHGSPACLQDAIGCTAPPRCELFGAECGVVAPLAGVPPPPGVAVTSGFRVPELLPDLPDFSIAEAQGIVGGELPECPGTVLPGKCAFARVLDALVACAGTDACRAIVHYFNGGWGRWGQERCSGAGTQPRCSAAWQPPLSALLPLPAALLSGLASPPDTAQAPMAAATPCLSCLPYPCPRRTSFPRLLLLS